MIADTILYAVVSPLALAFCAWLVWDTVRASRKARSARSARSARLLSLSGCLEAR